MGNGANKSIVFSFIILYFSNAVNCFSKTGQDSSISTIKKFWGKYEGELFQKSPSNKNRIFLFLQCVLLHFFLFGGTIK